MILRGFNSPNLITRGFGALGAIVELVYKWCSSIIQQALDPDTVRTITRRNKIRQQSIDSSTVKTYFKRR